ncbi:lipopolysaccharide biosynthesis protein [Dyella tabacisoli]|uniref:Polysaccharide biosynthesis protein n=1 Tax=Dyella tabacisoli TaxID=2282381 RepID=A0A369UPT7_9GAMM|nr:oligosaccharide flippase family protein [Dyella tabacisoli]RDD82487.1 polysaccharide biosynthesis protein [Dyella tabacisoli]
MPALRTNILANYAGQIWMALMSVAFVPLYVRALGMEAFGLVGLMLSLQSISLLLDLGMGNVLNRELARRSHNANTFHTASNLVRTLEWLVWPAAATIAVTIWLASGPLAHHWLRPQNLTPAETAHAIIVMGLAVALQWPSSFYSNGLSGLERQPVLNLINAGFATLRGVGVLPVLYWISPTISAFMWWYAAMGACQSLTSAFVLWRLMPTSKSRAQFQMEELRNVGRFAGGLIVITALSVALTQLDRIVLSTMRPLIELGYFTLALSVAAGLGRMIQPMFNALYPRYSRLVATSNYKALTELYHLSNQYLAVVIAAVSTMLIVFSKDVIYLWTGDAAMATKVATPLSILVAGTALNGMMNLPYALQLAHGWTRLTVGINLTALILGIPFCIWAVGHHGIVGAACLLLAINLGLVVIGIPLMHRRLMRGEMLRWYLRDTMPPIAVAATGALCAGWLIPTLSRNLASFFLLALASATTLLITILAAPMAREHIKQQLMHSIWPRKCN